jgi:hypothetical protein
MKAIINDALNLATNKCYGRPSEKCVFTANEIIDLFEIYNLNSTALAVTPGGNIQIYLPEKQLQLEVGNTGMIVYDFKQVDEAGYIDLRMFRHYIPTCWNNHHTVVAEPLLAKAS